MNRIGPLLDRLDTTTLMAVLALLGLAIGVALVFSAGWALIVASGLVLVYAILPDQKAAAE